MIKELHIANLAVIEDTTLNFQSPYVALIGETGAGKSLIVDSLGLLKGDRSDFALFRDPTKKATVSAVFSLTPDFLKKHPELASYCEGGDLIVRRSLFPDHSSRCYLNDEPLSLLEFRRVTAHLIDIHSQGANSSLLDASKHLFYLDSFGKEPVLSAREDYAVSFAGLKMKEQELSALCGANQKLDRDYLTFQIAEIEKADLHPNEIEDLLAEYESLRSFEKLKESFDTYQQATLLSEGNLKDIQSHLASTLNSFDGTPLAEQAGDAKEKLRTAQESLAAFETAFRSLRIDPQRIDAINERLFAVKGLQRKYGKSTEAILSKLAEYKSLIQASDDFEGNKALLATQRDALKGVALKKAQVLTENRRKAALRLTAAVGVAMADLGLRKDGFRVAFVTGDLTETGQDSVSFEVALNAGLDFAPLIKAASGGESSRLMLSLKAVLNALDPYDLVVFDEIDTGVSGRIASLIAQKIASISKASQVLVISHLPQVVASAFSFLGIEKKVSAGQTFTTARLLAEDDVVLEISKMLSGTTVTEEAKSQARKLLAECHSL